MKSYFSANRILVAVTFWLLAGVVHATHDIEIVIDGVSGELKDNVQTMLSIYQQKEEETLNKERIKRLFDRSKVEINKALQPFGYFNADVDAELQQLEENKWRIHYDIVLNEVMRITHLDVRLIGDAEQDSAFTDLLHSWPLKENAVLDQRVYQEAKLKLQNLAANRGYFDAQFVEHQIKVDVQRYQSEIMLHLDSGVRYRYGDVALDVTLPNKELVEKFINFKQGELYLLDDLIDLQNALNDSNYFDVVDVSPNIVEAKDGRVPINVQLTPQTGRLYSVGLGYGTDTGARARLGLDVPLINNAGHRFDSSLLVSEIKDSLVMHYRIPVLNPRTDELALSFSYDNEHTVSSENETYTIGSALLHSRGLWREALSISYQEERYHIADDEGRSVLLMPGVSWSRIWGKERIYTIKGASINLDFKVASEVMVSDVSFLHTKIHGKWIRTLRPNTRLITRATVGAVSTNNFEDVPSSIRFFAGGDNSVRGYRYNSLGPLNEYAEVEGGRGLMVASLEVEQNIWKAWALALFYDVGNAVDNVDESVKEGAGLGLRWKSPIGPIRFDAASALSEAGKPWRIHLNIGPDL